MSPHKIQQNRYLCLKICCLQYGVIFGHKNKNLKQGDLLSLFVTDIDQHLH